MSTPSTAPTVAPPEDAAKRPTSIRYRPWFLVIAVIVVLAAVAVIFVPSANVEQRALQRMAPADRLALYHVTLRDAEAICKQAEIQHAFRRRCLSSASFVLSFPECDASCRTFAQRYVRSTPSR